MAMTAAGLLLGMDAAVALPLRVLANLSSAIMAMGIIMVVYASSRGIWSASSIYVIVFSLFHFGLTLVYGLGLPIDIALEKHMNRWFYTPYLAQAIVLSSLGLLFYSMGVYIALLRQQQEQQNDEKISTGAVLLFAGLLATIISVFTWFYVVTSYGGTALLFSSYATFLGATEGGFLPYVYFGMGLGIALLGAAPPSRGRIAGFAVFAAWSLIALPLGLRGEVLIPALTACVLVSKRRPIISTGKALALGLALLVLINAMQQVRKIGVQGLSEADIQYNPLGALAEMGSSLRPVAVVVSWRDNGEDYIYGASYWAPVERALQLIVPFGVRLDASDDERLLNVLMARRAGPYGLSPIAEAYRNFGAIGVCFIMLLTGFLIGAMDTWPATHVRQIMLGIIMVTLLLQVRNAFTPVPAQLVMGFLVLGAIVLLNKIWPGEASPKARSVSRPSLQPHG